MSKQVELLGEHPKSPSIFGKWLTSEDHKVTASKCHRSLTSTGGISESELLDWLGRKIVEHHYDDNRLTKLKNKLSEVGFPKYAEQFRRLPSSIADKTRKGNATEILLSEYIQSCKNRSMVNAFKFRYNPNVDQSMKGDDVLLIDISSIDVDKKINVFFGEAKFREKAQPQVVRDIINSLGRDRLPLSYSFLVDELSRSPETEKLSNALDDFILEEVRDSGGLVYVGMLFSDVDAKQKVEKHLISDNPDLIFLSLGSANPSKLIDKAFSVAESYINNPHLL